MRQVAAHVLERVAAEGAYSHILVDRAGRFFARPEDRALLRELVGGTLRWRGRVDHLLEHFGSRPLAAIDPPLLEILRLGAYQLAFLERIPDWAAVDETVEAARRRCGPAAAAYANGLLRALARRRGRLPMPRGDRRRPEVLIARRWSLPEWLAGRWVRAWGAEEAARLAEAAAAAPPVCFRLCRAPSRPSRGEGEILDELRREGVVGEPIPQFPGAYRVTQGLLAGTTPFQQGWILIQDPASQAVPLLTGLTPGGTALDACSAPGGKAIRLAELVGEGGRVTATDLHPARIGLLRQNCRRLGLENVLALACDLEAAPPPFRRAFDAVLVDAPCSGTGTLRRHPEIRWRLAEADLAVLAERQLRLLRSAAGAVRPGGALVYAVCSLEPEEGAGVLERFLPGSGFELDDPSPLLPLELRPLLDSRGLFTTWPHRHGCDGFFAARLARRG